MPVGLVTGFTQSVSKPGLLVTINAGDAVVLGSLAHFNTSDISVPANALSFVYLNFISGLIESSTAGFLAGAWPICKAQTNTTRVTALTDMRPDVFGFSAGDTTNATPTLISHTAGQNGTSSPANFTTSAIDTTGATLLLVGVFCYNAAVMSVTDSKGNVWTALPQFGSTGVAGVMKLFYCPSPTVGTGHTFTGTGGTFVGASVAAFSGVTALKYGWLVTLCSPTP